MAAPLRSSPMEDHVRSAPAVEWSQLSSTDASLVEHCVAGDEDACRALVEAHEQMVF